MTKTVTINEKAYNVYATVDEADEYFAAKFGNEWVNVGETQKPQLLVTAICLPSSVAKRRASSYMSVATFASQHSKLSVCLLIRTHSRVRRTTLPNLFRLRGRTLFRIQRIEHVLNQTF